MNDDDAIARPGLHEVVVGMRGSAAEHDAKASPPFSCTGLWRHRFDCPTCFRKL